TCAAQPGMSALGHKRTFRKTTTPWQMWPIRSPLSVIRENVISFLHYSVAREPALGVVRLRRLISLGARPESIGRGAINEHGPSPPAAISEPLAVLHHEIHIMLGARHRRIREVLVLFRVPMDLRHFRTVGERLAVAGNTSLVGVDHHGISEDYSGQLVVLAGG